jgi:hypothetical protein
MRINRFHVCLILLVALILTGSVQAYEIFFWQHDNNLGIYDPVYRTTLTTTQALTRTLNDLDLDYTLNRTLPDFEDLSDYDIVMTSLGCYCPG